MKASQAAEIFKDLANEHRIQIMCQLLAKAMKCRNQAQKEIDEYTRRQNYQSY